MPRTAVLRFDASPTIGIGHAIRCIAIAEALSRENWSVKFATSANCAPTVKSLTQRWQVIDLPSDMQGEIGALAALGPCDLLLVDHYGRNAEFETSVRGMTRSLVALDDRSDTVHRADFVINPIPGFSNDTILSGPSYAPLRSMFLRRRRESAARRRNAGQNPKRALVGFGGFDSGGMAARAIAGVAAFDRRIQIDVVVGNIEEQNSALTSGRDHGITVRAHIRPTDPAGLAAEADIAFGNAGMTNWERCCLGLPSVMVDVVDNQLPVAQATEDAGAAIWLRRKQASETAHWLAAVKRLCESPDTLIQTSANALALCDGRGSARILTFIDRPLDRNGTPISLRPALPSDEAILLDWQREPGMRTHARQSGIPTEREHRAWFAAKRRNADCVFNIIVAGTKEVGFLRFDRIADTDRAWEVSIGISSTARQRGIAQLALALGRRLMADADLHARVLADNDASHQLFRRAGYKPVSYTHLTLPTIYSV